MLKVSSKCSNALSVENDIGFYMFNDILFFQNASLTINSSTFLCCAMLFLDQFLYLVTTPQIISKPSLFVYATKTILP